MKRHGNLYPQIYDMANIELAHQNARRRKAHYQEVKMVNADPERYLTAIHAMLKDKTFRNSTYTVFHRFQGGKDREIAKLPYYPDRIVHHSIMQVLEPIWVSTLIPDTYACVKGRGIHKGVARIRQALRDREGTAYCLKADVRKFYPSVDHDVLKATIRRKIKDADLLWLLDHIIDSAPGIPIGNYLSQHFGNLYLSGLDHWAKEEMGCRYYFRYADDIVVLHGDKAFLHGLRRDIDVYLRDRLKMNMKPDWQVFPVDARGIDVLGYRFFHGYTLLRKGIARRIMADMASIRTDGRRMDPLRLLSAAMSYYGWMRHANCLHLIRRCFDRALIAVITAAARQLNVRNPLGRIAALGVRQ